MVTVKKNGIQHIYNSFTMSCGWLIVGFCKFFIVKWKMHWNRQLDLAYLSVKLRLIWSLWGNKRKIHKYTSISVTGIFGNMLLLISLHWGRALTGEQWESKVKICFALEHVSRAQILNRWRSQGDGISLCSVHFLTRPVVELMSTLGFFFQQKWQL